MKLLTILLISCSLSFAKPIFRVPDTSNHIVNKIKQSDIKYKDVVLAQAALESTWFTSGIAKSNHNLFGMKDSRRTVSNRVKNGYAYYKSYDESILDFYLWQTTIIHNHHIHNKEQYINYLSKHYTKNKKTGIRYKRDIHSILKSNKRLMNYMNSPYVININKIKYGDKDKNDSGRRKSSLSSPSNATKRNK